MVPVSVGWAQRQRWLAPPGEALVPARVAPMREENAIPAGVGLPENANGTSCLRATLAS
jgi:hypothetical protein